MAEDQTKSTGGNSPKPATSGQKPANQSAKDRSRAQSRSVSGKVPGGKGGNTPRPGGRPAAASKPRGVSGALIAWGVVGLVVLIIVVLVVVKLTTGSSNSTTNYTPVTSAPASVVKDVTTIPASIYNAVGVTIPSSANPAQPIVLSNQPALTLGGRTPAMMYYGGEYCPFCAAERWAMTAALSRFGTWANLDVTASSHTDVYADTNTLSFRKATLTSQYIAFTAIEACSNIPDASATTCSGYKPLASINHEEVTVLNKYSSPTYIPGATSGQVSFPFVDIGNVMLVSGASFSPGILTGLSHQQIASDLRDPTNLVTQAIVGTANYMSAGICASTKQQPSTVCQSSGVQAADKALKLS